MRADSGLGLGGLGLSQVPNVFLKQVFTSCVQTLGPSRDQAINENHFSPINQTTTGLCVCLKIQAQFNDLILYIYLYIIPTNTWFSAL